MVSGYLSGSISRSASASGVTHPAQILTRGKTAASSTSVRCPASARRHAAVLPPGPPPTTMTSNGEGAGLMPSPSPQGEEKPDLLQRGQPESLDLVGHGHHGEHVALEVHPAAHVSLGEVGGRRIFDKAQKRLRRLDDHRAERLVAGQRYFTAVPEPEGQRRVDPSEDFPEDGRRAARAGSGKNPRQHGWGTLAMF